MNGWNNSCHTGIRFHLILYILQLSCGTAKRCALKDKHSNMKAKAGGVVMLECDLVYNYIKAAVRAFKPREVKMTEEKFNRKVRSGRLICLNKVAFNETTLYLTFTFMLIKFCAIPGHDVQYSESHISGPNPSVHLAFHPKPVVLGRQVALCNILLCKPESPPHMSHKWIMFSL